MEQTAVPTKTNTPSLGKLNRGGTMSILVFALLLGVVGLLLIYSDSQKNPDEQVNQNDNSISNNLPVSTESFSEVSDELTEVNGSYLSLTMPSNWGIVEYPIETDPGVGELSGDVYGGLTAFNIYDQDNKLIFSLGGALEETENKCFEIYQFSDTDQNYIDAKVNEAKDLGISEPEVIMLDDFTEFNLLGDNVRRVGYTLYFDTDNGESFNPACGMDSLLRSYEGLSFAVDEVNSDKYRPVIHDAALENVLIPLDSALNSLVINQ